MMAGRGASPGLQHVLNVFPTTSPQKAPSRTKAPESSGGLCGKKDTDAYLSFAFIPTKNF